MSQRKLKVDGWDGIGNHRVGLYIQRAAYAANKRKSDFFSASIVLFGWQLVCKGQCMCNS